MSYILVLLLGSSCEDGQELLFHAGVGQRSSLNTIKELYERENPGTHVNFAYKGSGYFLADIARSRRGDLFMPGEEFYLLQAQERGFIADYDRERDVPACFITVILTPRGNPKNIRSIMDLARPGVRVGLGNPRACAIGLWHEKSFRRAGIWEEVQRNATMSAKCIPELGNAAQHQLIDATIVWATTAVLYLRDCEILPLERRYRGVVRLPVAVLSFAKHREVATQLKDLILSERGREIFASHAYATGPLCTDEDGFLMSDDDATDALMEQLRCAAEVVKNDDHQLDVQMVGPLIGEVRRQLRTRRAGN